MEEICPTRSAPVNSHISTSNEQVGHIRIVSCLTRPDVDSTGTADGNGAVMMIKSRALIGNMFLEQWHIVE